MSKQGLVDHRAYLQVIGCLLKQASLIDSQDFPLDRIDFNTDKFYEYLFVALHNLYINGAESISEFDVDSVFSSFPEQYKVFQEHDGLKYLVDAREMAQLDNYEYYYHRVKKFSLLRYYVDKGLDISPIYDASITDPKLEEKQRQKFEELTEADIIGKIEDVFVLTPKNQFVTNILTDEQEAGHNLTELVDRYLKRPDYGYPLASIALTTLLRGARPGTLYLRSMITGGGKTRQAIMDACNFAVPYVYDLKKKKFVYTGHSVPTLFVGVEGSVVDFQKIVLATVSKVSTDHIQKGKYEAGELERVRKATKYIEDAPLYLAYCDDYSISDIENLVKKYVITKGIEVCMFDYLQSSLRLMAEIRSKGAAGMQEYQMLRVFATRLKALAERLRICIISATQLNDTVNEKKYKDQSVLEGSKSTANKIDDGIVCTRPTQKEKAMLDKIVHNQVGCPEINLLQWCYKMRDGEYSRIIICSHIDLGVMTIKDCFITDYDFNLIDIELDDVQVMDEDTIENIVDEHSIAIDEVPEIEEEEQPQRKFDW